MASINKSQLLAEVQTQLKQRYTPGTGPEKLSVLEAVLYGICREGVTRASADAAMAEFKSDFFDWNEVRVSSVEEIQKVFRSFPDPEPRANRLRKFLRQLFSKTYSFNLDALIKKPQKDAVKALGDYEALSSDYVMATVIRLALGGHAIPVDHPTRRALTRIGIEDTNADDSTLRAVLERAVPKNRGAEFLDLIESLAHDVCLDPIPTCPTCEIKNLCPFPTAKPVPVPATPPTPAPAKAKKTADPSTSGEPKTTKSGVKSSDSSGSKTTSKRSAPAVAVDPAPETTDPVSAALADQALATEPKTATKSKATPDSGKTESKKAEPKKTEHKKAEAKTAEVKTEPNPESHAEPSAEPETSEAEQTSSSKADPAPKKGTTPKSEAKSKPKDK